jgi:hypothetical protein
MKRQWDIEELIEHFTLVPDDLELLANKTGPTRLGCAIFLKYFQYEGRFPAARQDVPRAVVDYIARQLKVHADLLAQYDWEGRTIRLHRTQIREHLGYREATAADSEAVSSWLISTHLASDQNLDHLKAKVLAEFHKRKIEPPTSDRIERLICSACAIYEQTLFASVIQRLAPETRTRLDALLDRSIQVEEQDEPVDDEPSSKGTSRRESITWGGSQNQPRCRRAGKRVL